MSYWERIKCEWLLACKGAGVFSIVKWLVWWNFKEIVKVFLRGEWPLWGVDRQIKQAFVYPKTGKRILLFSQDASCGSGAFRSCAALAKELRHRLNIDVIVVLAQKGTGEGELKNAKIPYMVIPSKWWLVPVGMPGRKCHRDAATMFVKNHRAVRTLCWVIRNLDVDLVHVNSMSCYVAGLAAKYCNVPVVWHARDLLEEDHGLKIYNREVGLDLIRNTASTVIAVSNCVKRKYDPIFGEDKVVRIYNGVDRERFYRPSHSILEDKKVTFVFLGNFQRHKGHLVFAKACAELCRRGRIGFNVWYVGNISDKNYYEACKSEFVSVGAEQIVRYWGEQDRPERIVENADVAIVASRCEAFGRVTVEMMMAGCLAIGSNTGCTAELIEDGKTGLLYHYIQNGMSDLPDKMEWILDHFDESRHIAAAGREWIAARMTAERNADKIAAVYKDLYGL